MKVNYTYNKAKSYVHCVLEGDISLSDVIQYVAELAANPQIDRPFVEIIDFLKVDKLDFGYLESSTVQQQYKHLEHYKASIFIVDGDYLRGLTNLFISAGEERELSLDMVSSMEEAIEKVPFLLA